MAFDPSQLMQMQAVPPRQLPPQAQAYGQAAPGIYQMQPPQAQPPMMPPQAMGNPMGPMGGDRRAQMQDWRAQRPMRPEDMSQFDPQAWRQQMQDWRQLRPQNGQGGVQGLAAMHARNLDMARPQIAPQGFAPQQQRFAPQQSIAPQPAQPIAQPNVRRGGY